MSNSCYGCKFLYADGYGYSDYTWMDTWVKCAQGKNPALIEDVSEPIELSADMPELQHRCEMYFAGPYITITPDGEVEGDFADEDQEAAIMGYTEVCRD